MVALIIIAAMPGLALCVLIYDWINYPRISRQ